MVPARLGVRIARAGEEKDKVFCGAENHFRVRKENQIIYIVFQALF
ncbi:hypothetical protein ACFQ1Y_14115 [Virgibacillus alimentarius]